ncbi:uncharacterized protein BDR25DRAFT_243093, partial [Lindgomyces ingoldianus]
LEGGKMAPGKNPPETLNSAQNLAGALWDWGKCESTEKKIQRVPNTRADTVGDAYLDTLATRGNLASVLRN